MNKIFFSFIFLLNACAIFIPKNQGEWKRTETRTLTPHLCKIHHDDLSIISSSEPMVKIFKKNLREVENLGFHFDFIDKAVLWSLVQIVARPDTSSGRGRLQFVLIEKDQHQYFDAFSGETPYLDILEYILKKKKSQYTLLTLAKIADQYFGGPYKIDEKLAKFLNLASLSNQSEEFSSFFIRGEEVLKEDESLPRPRLEKLVKGKPALKEALYSEPNKLITYVDGPNLSAQCNYDLGLYDHSIFLLSPKELESNFFGLADGNSSFMASASFNPLLSALIKGTPYFMGEAPVRATPFCKTQHKENSFWFMATHGRDPVQYLHQLYQTGPDKFKNLATVAASIGQARHLFMTSPFRVAFEFQRSNEKRRKEITLLDLPVYQADQLGMIWTWAKTEKALHFILDDRYQEGHLCPL